MTPPEPVLSQKVSSSKCLPFRNVSPISVHIIPPSNCFLCCATATPPSGWSDGFTLIGDPHTMIPLRASRVCFGTRFPPCRALLLHDSTPPPCALASWSVTSKLSQLVSFTSPCFFFLSPNLPVRRNTPRTATPASDPLEDYLISPLFLWRGGFLVLVVLPSSVGAVRATPKDPQPV